MSFTTANNSTTITLPQGSAPIGKGGLEFEILPNKTVVLSRYQGQVMNKQLLPLDPSKSNKMPTDLTKVCRQISDLRQKGPLTLPLKDLNSNDLEYLSQKSKFNQLLSREQVDELYSSNNTAGINTGYFTISDAASKSGRKLKKNNTQAATSFDVTHYDEFGNELEKKSQSIRSSAAFAQPQVVQPGTQQVVYVHDKKADEQQDKMMYWIGCLVCCCVCPICGPAIWACIYK